MTELSLEPFNILQLPDSTLVVAQEAYLDEDPGHGGTSDSTDSGGGGWGGKRGHKTSGFKKSGAIPGHKNLLGRGAYTSLRERRGSLRDHATCTTHLRGLPLQLAFLPRAGLMTTPMYASEQVVL